jgi:cytochrome c2
MGFMVNGRSIALILAAMAAAGPAMAQDAGAAVFQGLCSACHSVAKPPVSKSGPSLVGVVGRKAGTAAGFNYSPAMKAYGKAWTPAALDAYLTAPMQTVPGTKMVFLGVKDAAKRASLIGFLKEQE